MSEIITPAEALTADLAAIAANLNDRIDLVAKHEDAFEEATLEPRLLIGQQIANAQELFGLTKPAAMAVANDARLSMSRRDNESMSRRDTTSPALDPGTQSLGFQSWLKLNVPRLKRPTALK